MAGNWKMNLDHLEANHLVQGLAMALSDAGHDYSKCEVLVIPPFTDIRTVQTIVDADELSIKTVRRTCRSTTTVPTPAKSPLRCSASSVSPTLSWATRSVASTTNESDELVGAKARKVFGRRHDPDPVLRRGPRGPQGWHLR